MTHNKKIAAVLYGGRSAEHEISIITALQAIEALDSTLWEIVPVYITQDGSWHTGVALLDKAFYRRLPHFLSQTDALWAVADPSIGGFAYRNHPGKVLRVDVCLVACHGQEGEDGCLQGLLQMAGLPYTCCGVAASSMAMDKYASKMFLQAHGVPTLPCLTIDIDEARRQFQQLHRHVALAFGEAPYPLFVKPRRLGSSIGVAAASDASALERAVAQALYYDSEAIIEPCVDQRLEINVAVRHGHPPVASAVEIPLNDHGDALSYEDKYLRNQSKFAPSQGMASLSRLIDPADLDPALKNLVQRYAVRSYELMRCQGVVRFDFIFDLAANALYFNELNPIPGSLSFYLWQQSQPPLLYSDLLDDMLNAAIDRHHAALAQQRRLPFRALLR